MNSQRLPTTGTQASLPGLTPSPISPTPFSPDFPTDIIATAVRRIQEVTQNSELPVTLNDILRDAVVCAFQRGKAEERAEANLLMESMDKINDRRAERTTELVVMQCMDAMCIAEMTVDLSRSLNGNLTMRLDDGARHIVHYTYDRGVKDER